ncbi:MAG TPA: hypothetical protein VG096_06185 [Bryobacteraceae bacterium]|jgi:hypothetical protein|nr:hypothetical protein [Bryobacteraceae bacterium]
MSIVERDGMVLVHCHAGCSQADVIAALRARGLWPEREKLTWTPAERTDWGRQQRDLERALPSAQLWRRAAVRLQEESLVLLKARLFDPVPPIPEDLSEPVELVGAGIYQAERALAWLRRLQGKDLVAEYRWWLGDHPGWTFALLRAGHEMEAAERRALRAYLAGACG